MIALFVVARNHHASGSWIFGNTLNQTGWSSDGFAFVLAITNAVFAYLGSDCGAHLCEEIPNPGRNVPRVILWPLLIGLLTAFPFACSLMYAITDLKAVLNTPSGIPLIEIYYQGTGSEVAASILLAFFAFCFFGCLVAACKSPISEYSSFANETSYHMFPHALGRISRWCATILQRLDESSSVLERASKCNGLLRRVHHGKPYVLSPNDKAF